MTTRVSVVRELIPTCAHTRMLKLTFICLNHVRYIHFVVGVTSKQHLNRICFSHLVKRIKPHGTYLL